MTALLAIVLKTETRTCSFYGAHYEKPCFKRGCGRKDGRHRFANGQVYTRDSKIVATWAYPMGTKLEIKANGRTVVVVVGDRPAPKHGHKLDLPDGVWNLFGYPRSKGLFQAEVRMLK